MKTFFISDTHFGDDTIRRYENRPFENIHQMDEFIIKSWNSVVTDEDTVFFLGDFSSNNYERDKEVLSLLKGKKLLVKGNHDNHRTNEEWRKAGFFEVYDLPVIFKDFFILSHMPLYVCTNMPYANIFGHVHNNPSYKDISSQSACACCERLSYIPIEFNDVLIKIKESK